MQTAAMAASVFVQIVFALASYIFMALCLQTIARKLGAKDPWMAWVPVLNIYQWVVLAEKPAWWIILCFVPVVNIVIFVLLWMRIAERRNRPNWWGVLMMVPFINYGILALLAFSESNATPLPPPPGI